MDQLPTTERRIISRVLFAALALIVVVLLAMLVGMIRMARHRAALLEALSRYEDSRVEASYKSFIYSPPPSSDIKLEDGSFVGRMYFRGGQREHGFFIVHERPFWANWVANIIDNDPFAEVQNVEINDERFSDGDVPALQWFPGLRVLDLSATGITDDGVFLLANNVKLTKLKLWQTQISDRSLLILDTLSELRELDIAETNITKSALEEFRKRHPDCLVFD